MRRLTPKRLTAWLLTLVMALSLLPAAALADEADDGLSPPAPQKDYGYVRLVFSEGAQLDLHHGEYITEPSPTAEVFGNASEDLITDGEYAALYYAGRLYHKAALDGVRIDADAVLPAEDFALVPMGELAAQTPPSGAEPAPLPTTGTTTEPTEETTTEPTEETTTEPTEETTTEPTEGTNTEPTGETTTEPTETTTEPTTETTEETTGETTEKGQPAPEVRKAPQRAAGDKYGYVSFQFRVSGEKAIQLHSGEYINVCVGNTVPTMWQATAEYPDIYDFIRDGDYKALHYHGFLYLKGELDLHGANINMDMMKLGFGISPKIYVKDNASLYNSDSLIYSYDTGVEIFLPTGKKLELNAAFPGVQKYPGAIRVAGEATITGGGTLDILYTLINTESGTTPRTLFGIYGGEGVTLRGSENHGTGPTVNIKMDSGAFGPEANDVVGIRSGGDLIIKGDSKVKIEMLGHKLGQTTTEEDVNRAITAKRLELLNNASLEILSHKNVIHDIVLTAESGDVLKVDTTGFLNIRNKGNIQRYDEGTWQHLQNDYPKSNIHLFKGSAQGAIAKIIRAEQGVKIESFSASINDWYNKLNDPEQGNWNWAISGTDEDPALGTNMYRGNRRIDNIVQVDSTTSIYTWGSMEYIYEPQGVVTVQRSNGLIMGWHKPEDDPNGSSLYYAKVLEPNFNDIHILRKGESLTLVAPDGKGTFLYWYDAQNPEGSANGTSWKNLTQKFTNIQRDMTLVPVRDPMTAGPTLSDVGYSVQWDKGVTKQTRYAYQDMTFAKANDIISTGGYRVMLVPAQLPAYGEKTYAVKDLDGSPLMSLRSARLYADKNAFGGTDELGNWHFNIPTGSYRIAYNDDATNKCFFSKPFTFDPPVAPPYIDPITKIEDTGGTKQVKITAERNQPIKYRQWDYTKNKWGSLQDYTDPFDVTVTADQDVRIKAYAGPITKEITSEVRYAVRPTGTPTVKHGETVVSDGVRRYFYDSIDLTVEAPEGYEVWYRVGEQPSESEMGTKVMEGGKVTITDSGSHGIIFFKLAKAFTVDGVTYRKLSHNYTSVHLSKLTELPAPKVTVKTKEGGQTLIPSGNTYTMTENVVTVTLEPNGNWPLDATIAYDTNGNATPRLSTSYTTPFEVRGAGTLAVFTLVPDANGGYDYERKECIFKLAENLQTVPISTYGGNCTAYYTDENGVEQEITSFSQALKVGTKVRVVPNTPAQKAFKKWEIGNYSEYSIWENTIDGPYDPELIFHVPKPINDPYSQKPKTLTITATFAEAAEASISGVTKVDLVMNKTVGESISLNYSNKAMRTISYQWWEGSSAGAEDDVLPGAVTFDPDKTYTVQVTIKANPGASFTTTSGVAIGNWGEHFTVPDDKLIGTYDTLTVTATPIRQIDLTMPAPLTIGDPLPTIADVGGVPEGVTAQKLEWPYTTGNTVPETHDGKVRAALTLKTDGTRPFLVGVSEYKHLTVNGDIVCQYMRNGSNNYVTDGSTVTVGNIDLPVKPKGVSVSGMVKSYNPKNATTIQLMQDGAEKYSTTIAADTDSGQVPQNFSFPAVAPGTYDLVVTKKAHLTYTVTGVVVGDTALDLTTMTDKPYSTITLLCGDINGDGNINVTDLNKVWDAANFNKNVSAATNKLTDINGDGSVNVTDLNVIWDAANFNKGITACTHGF